MQEAPPAMRRSIPVFIALAGLFLAGCEQLGIESPEKTAAAREADGKAVGGACRHAGRAIEDCYAIYKKADRAAIYAGWRDMNDYMRENKIEPVMPQLTAQALAGSKSAAGARAKADADAEKAAEGRPAKDGKASDS
jgi:hypothetical protein